MILELVLVLVLLYLGYLWTFKSKDVERFHLPPTPPWKLPLIGHLYLFKDDPIQVCMELGQKFGGIFQFGFGPKATVMITDYNLIEEAMRTDSLPSRPLKEIPSQVLIRGRRNPDGSLPGIAFSDGEIWREQRKFAFQQLITLGFGKIETTDEIIRVECDDIYDRMRPKPTTLDSNFFISNALNVVWHFITGSNRKVSDKLLLTAKDFMRTQQPTPLGVLLLYFPTLLRLTAWLGFRNALSARRAVDEILESEIEEHERTLDPNLTRDFIDAFLMKIKQCSDKKSSFYGDLGRLNMRNSLFDLFIAGMDTTATTMSWAIIYMMRWPDVQTRVQEEIDRVIGDATASLSHRTATPYVEATLLEIQRYACVVPWGPRATLEDVKVGSYDIPKNTHVLYIIRAITRNPKFFSDPDSFKPERFLNENGTSFVKNDLVATFGLGKRKCPGENVARLELYLFFVTIMKHFRFEVPNGSKPEDIDMSGEVGNVVEPKPVQCQVTLRKSN